MSDCFGKTCAYKAVIKTKLPGAHIIVLYHGGYDFVALILQISKCLSIKLFAYSAAMIIRVYKGLVNVYNFFVVLNSY